MFSVRPLTTTIGAELTGLDLAATDGKLDDPTAARLLEALVDRKVVFLRGQDITPHQQRTFASHLGTLQRFPDGTKAAPDLPDVMVIDTGAHKPTSRADLWHSDATWMRCPPTASVLHAVTLPPVGGDTVWADMEAAYLSLSAPLRSMLDGLTAEHDPAMNPYHRKNLDREAFPVVTHPVVRTHPVSGRRSLFVNRDYTTRIVELDTRENERLLPYLKDLPERVEFQCRWAWRPGDVAIWDNRAAQHNAVYDYAERRVMHRIVIEGDAPR